MDEISESKNKDFMLDSEIKNKVESIENEKSALRNELMDLKKQLDSSRKELNDKVANFELEKVELRERIKVSIKSLNKRTNNNYIVR